jgi:choline dehydrogenase-like flavoprotein
VPTLAAQAVRGSGRLVRFAVNRQLARPGRRLLALRIMTEQRPDRDSRIRLGAACDGFGVPRVELDWRIGADDLDTIRRHQDVLDALLSRQGVGRVTERFDADRHASPIMSNYHHMGATRMHTSPREGVVDAQCRVHSAPNLFVAGGSVFPAGGYLNPTLTIIALALRVSDAIRRDHDPVRVG